MTLKYYRSLTLLLKWKILLRKIFSCKRSLSDLQYSIKGASTNDIRARGIHKLDILFNHDLWLNKSKIGKKMHPPDGNRFLGRKVQSRMNFPFLGRAFPFPWSLSMIAESENLSRGKKSSSLIVFLPWKLFSIKEEYIFLGLPQTTSGC